MHGGNVWDGDPKQWLDFSANLIEETPDWVVDALTRAIGEAGFYPDSTSLKEREALAVFIGIPQSCVLPTAGGASAIRMAATLSRGTAWLVAPCFTEYERAVSLAGGSARFVSILDGHTILQPSKLLAGRIGDGDTVWLCNPLNPVGIAFDREEVTALLTLAEQNNAWLIVDEAFIQFASENTSISLVSQSSHIVIIGSLTKALCIPGVRLG